MAYFLKKTTNKKGQYLQIYESFYNPKKGYSSHKSYKWLGYTEELRAQGIDDPISYFQAEVDALNLERKKAIRTDRARQISEESPERFLGYFPLKSINDGIGVRQYMDLLQKPYGFKFSLYDLLSSLIYARAVQPCSKHRTFHDVLPSLFEERAFSEDQMYRGIGALGNEYEKVIEIYNECLSPIYKFDMSNAYFDCTNFYFEIDKEDSLRRKGPSKENRREPVAGMGLLLDANQIPMGMKVFPGNESEKPVIRDAIDSLKNRHGVEGRTIRVADKGLNCAENIFHAIENGDGYLFSKSVKTLPQTERAWVLSENDYEAVPDDTGKVLYKAKECVDDFPYVITDAKGKKTTVKLKEKRVATYNPDLAKKKLYEIDRQVEKARGLCVSKAKRDEYGESSKYVDFKPTDKKGKETDGKVTARINEGAIERDRMLAGYNLLVTSEIQMSKNDIYATYHNLWRIEESFRIMKSQLDARPVFLQNEDAITGHFVICYLAVLLLRILQIVILKDKYGTGQIMGMIKGLRIVKVSEHRYINMTRSTPFIRGFAKQAALPVTSYFLSETQVNEMLHCKL